MDHNLPNRTDDPVTFLQWALPRLGYRWPGFRKPRRQILRRIKNRMGALGLSGFADYATYLEQNPSEWQTLDALCDVTISRFFRDRKLWDFLREEVFRKWVDDKAGAADENSRMRMERRIWSAGSCNGEEAYSAAITLAELGLINIKGNSATRIQLHKPILASDRNDMVLQRARAGIYEAGALKELKPAERERWFVKVDNAPNGWGDVNITDTSHGNSTYNQDDPVLYRIRSELRDLVHFEQRDIRKSLPDGPFDLIFCRNLAFTYFTKDRQQEFLDELVSRLAADGFLVAGANETIPDTGRFEPVSKTHPVYRKRSETASEQPASRQSKPRKNRDLTLFLAGDVMTGRGVDQRLPRSVDPVLYEPYVKSAEQYVRLAERRSGPIPHPLTFEQLWGDALTELKEIDPDVNLINLETAATTWHEPWPEKGIHYRMHPDNTALLDTAGIDVCILANNHAMDWGRPGLEETIRSIRSLRSSKTLRPSQTNRSDQKHKVSVSGAGPDAKSAALPVIRETQSGRLLIFSYASTCSGAPLSWKAAEGTPGINVLNGPGTASISKVIRDVRSHRKPGDRVVISIHWGGNWGYDIPSEQRTFAHSLVDAGTADIIYGHSSHHPKRIEIYEGRLILYGCGDLINDYEGIGGYEDYLDDLSLMYFPRIDAAGALVSLEIAPMKIHRFSLCYPSEDEVAKLVEILNNDQHLHTWIQLGVRSEWVQNRSAEKDRKGHRCHLRFIHET